jgi:hypothetical protein
MSLEMVGRLHVSHRGLERPDNGFRRVILSLEAGGADVLWSQNEQQDTIGHEENGYLAHQLAD